MSLSPGRRRWLTGLLAGLPAWPVRAGEGASLYFGQSAPMTGPAQHWGLEYQRGLRLAFDEVNERGGVHGRQLGLISLDDQYEPDLALANTRELIDADKVFGLVGFVGAESAQRCLRLAVQAELPFIAPLTGHQALRQSAPRWLLNLRPGDDAETGLLARALATIDYRRVAVLQQQDADGLAALQSLRRSMTAAGLPAPAAVVGVGRNTTEKIDLQQRDIELAVRALRASQPQAVVCLSAYPTTAAVVRLLRVQGYSGACYATSLSSSAALGPLLGPHAAGLGLTQVVPSPFDSSRPVVARYLRRLPAGVMAEYVSLEGWIAGLSVILGLVRAGPQPSRERFMTAMTELDGLDLGGLALHWSALQRQLLSAVRLTLLDSSGRPRS